MVLPEPVGDFTVTVCLAAAVGNDVEQFKNSLFLEFKKVNSNAVYHVSPTSFSSKLK